MANLGKYNPDQQLRKMRSILNAGFQDIRKNRNQLLQSSLVNVDDESVNVPDSSEPSPAQICFQEIAETCRRIDGFTGQHFTEQYRLHQEEGTELLLQLDELDISGLDNGTVQKNEAYLQVLECLKRLEAKTHQDGKLCDQCELKFL